MMSLDLAVVGNCGFGAPIKRHVATLERVERELHRGPYSFRYVDSDDFGRPSVEALAAVDLSRAWNGAFQLIDSRKMACPRRLPRTDFRGRKAAGDSVRRP